MAKLRIVTTRAPGLVPDLIREINRAERPVVLIPESFTLACETEIVNRSENHGIFDLPIFSPSSFVREIRELTGYGVKKPVSADGQNMMLSRVLHRHQDELKYYRDSVAQPTLAQKIANQINDFTRARLSPAFLRKFQPSSRRTLAKVEDLALLWDAYLQTLGDEYEDGAGQWLSALEHLAGSGLLRNASLLIYGFDYITHDLLNLVRAACAGEAGAREIVIGLICDSVGPDREIFRAADDSVRSLEAYLERHPIVEYTKEVDPALPAMEPGIAYVEKTLYANGAFASGKIHRYNAGDRVIRPELGIAQAEAQAALSQESVPDLSHVCAYYAKNSYLECQHACQTLIEWRQSGIPWEEMAIAVCEQNTLPSLLPLTLSAAGIPFNAKQDQPILTSGYAQFFLSLLRILRLNFCQRDVLRLLKTGFTDLTETEVMDMENYVRRNGIHRNRWLRPFHIPEKDDGKAEQMEALRLRLIEPILSLKGRLSDGKCTGKQAAAMLFQYITDCGIYEKLLAREEKLALQGDDLGIDRNRQVWTAINELLDAVAAFIGDEPLPMHDLCTMLEASLASRNIKSLPQLSRAVTVAPPQMFFSSGVRCMIVMGLQENEMNPGGGILSEHERGQLERFIEDANREFYLNTVPDGGKEKAAPRPFSKIGQSLLDLAARQKQDVYQAVSLAREQLMISCSGARPSGGVLTQSTAFKKLYQTLSETNPENVSGGLTHTDIRPFAPAFALETLAVRMRDTLGSEESFLRGTSEEDLLWQDALGALYQSETWRERTKGVLNGLHVTVPSGGLSREQASLLYQGRAMSISRVETFGVCPWRHLLQYGLELVPTGSYAYARDEQGTFYHDVLRIFLDEAMKLPEWPDLSERQERILLNRVLADQVRQWEGGILRSDTVHRYQSISILHGIRTAIASMMRAFRRKPHFLPMATEVPFGMSDEQSRLRLPSIDIRTLDGTTVAFSGKIDRIDRLALPDGKQYFMIIDHKLSDHEVRQNSLLSGLQLQLPLYILAARNGLRGFEAAGGLYQTVRDELADSEDRKEIITKIDQKLRTAGMILADQTVQEAMQPVKIGNRSEKSDTISMVSHEQLRETQDSAEKVVAGQVDRIRNGETAPCPLQDGQRSPCELCEHTDACLYDPTLPGCGIRVLDHKHRMEMNPS